jgi:hypothetical protein
MFKSITLRKLENEARVIIELHQELLDKYNANATVRSKTNHHCVQEVDGVDYIIPFGIVCSFSEDEFGVCRFSSITSVNFCMNSVHKIAKARNEKPADTLRDVLYSFFDGLKQGVYHREIMVRDDTKYSNVRKAV